MGTQNFSEGDNDFESNFQGATEWIKWVVLGLDSKSAGIFKKVFNSKVQIPKVQYKMCFIII